MIRHELHKIISNKMIVVLAILTLCINVVLQIYAEHTQKRYIPKSYNMLWRDIEAQIEEEQTWSGVIKELSDKINTISNASRFEKNSLAEYTDKYSSEIALLERVRDEIEFQADYPGYLANIDTTADYYKALSLFGNVEGYAYANILKMKELYSALERIELVPEQSAGIELAVSSGVTDILALMFILFVSVVLWLKEREQNVMLLIRTTSNGRIKLAMAKLVVLVLVCVFLGIGLYGGNAIAGAAIYGLGNLDRPLANVYEFGHTLWEINTITFLFLNVFFKIIVYIWIGVLMSAICCKLTNSMAAFGGIVAFGAIGCIMYYYIEPLSIWRALKYLNPFAVLKTELLFMDYRDLNFFETPVDYRMCMMVMLPVGLVIFTVLTLIFFSDYMLKGKKRRSVLVEKLGKVFSSLRRYTERHTVLLIHEVHRIFICHKSIIVLAIFILLIINNTKTYDISYMSLEDYYEHVYLKELRGPLTDEKLEYIRAEEKRLEKITNRYEDAQQKALSFIKERLVYIKENEDACLVYELPHEILVAAYDDSKDILCAIMALIPIVLIMPCFFAPDLQLGMFKVTEVTLHGRRKLKILRYTLGIVVSLGIALAVHMLYLRQIIVSYEVAFEEFSYPVNSIPHLAGFGNGMTIGTYYFIIYMLKTLATVVGAFLVYSLSRLFKSQSYTTLASFMLLVIPFLMTMYDDRIIYSSYLYSVALGNMVMKNCVAAVVCVATVIIVSVTLYAINRRRKVR